MMRSCPQFATKLLPSPLPLLVVPWYLLPSGSDVSCLLGALWRLIRDYVRDTPLIISTAF